MRFDELFQQWQELRLINQRTIKNWHWRLQRRISYEEITRLIEKLTKHHAISEIKEITDYLKNVRKKFPIGQVDKKKLQMVTDFLNKKMPLAEFIHPNYPVLAQRLKHNEIAIFLGSNLTEQLTPALAKIAQYTDFKG